MHTVRIFLEEKGRLVSSFIANASISARIALVLPGLHPLITPITAVVFW